MGSKDPAADDYRQMQQRKALRLIRDGGDVRIALEERVSLSPDALTGMEASLRFPGHEGCDSKIFGRLSAWQNWIFTRPNATGEQGALSCYGRPDCPVFDWRRT